MGREIGRLGGQEVPAALLGQRLAEAGEVVPVAVDRVLGQAALDRQALQVQDEGPFPDGNGRYADGADTPRALQISRISASSRIASDPLAFWKISFTSSGLDSMPRSFSQ